MRSAAPRLLACLSLTFLAGCTLAAAEPGNRSAPTRPGAAAPAGSRSSTAGKPEFNPPPKARTKSSAAAKPRRESVTTISLSSVAAQLGMKLSLDKTGREARLSDAARRMEFEVDSRETKVDGLRLFLGDPVTMRSGQLQISRTDYEACVRPLLRPAQIRARPPLPKVIAIDAGHGGNDTGTENPRLGLQEKVFTLDVARRAKKLLETRGYRVVLTRDSDEKVELAERAVIANRAGADLFVSIHFNSLFPDTKTTGAEVFTFTRAGQRSDQSRGFGQPDDTEEDDAPVNRFDPWSVLLAQNLHRETIAALKLPDRGHKTKHLGMMRGLKCPAALVESGFLSNDVEAKKISTSAYRQDIAEALVAGIESYASIVRTTRPK